jgi:ABC-type nitrate/sulfonate/bicarbonate transport system permease component
VVAWSAHVSASPPLAPPSARPRAAVPAALIVGAASIATLVVAWQVVAMAGIVPARVLPTPLDVALRFATLAVETFSGSTLEGHALASLTRWVIGAACAIALGIPLGVALAWLPPLRPVIAPAFELLRFIPPFAWVPIAVLWFGASTTTQALIVFIAAFPACVINAHLGVSLVDPILPRAAAMLGAGGVATLRRVVLPVAAPSIFTGVRIAFSNGWMALVGAELVVGKQGLGFLISQGQINDSVTTIMVGMIAIGALGALIDFGFQRVERAWLPWLAFGAKRAS